MRRLAVRASALALLGAACAEKTTDISVGQALVVVDTDMPVPAHASRLRIDLFTAEGRWYASRDVSLARASDWPTSFGAFVPEGEAERVVIIRLRAYPEGGVRDYRGERFAPRPPRSDAADALLEQPLPPPSGQPRLVDESGVDTTPSTEPQPLLAIDRLIRVRVRQHERRRVRVFLRGECVGVRADLAGLRSCVDRDGELAPIVEPPLDEDLSVPERSAAETFDPARPCTAAPRSASTLADGTPLHDEEVCLPGAMFRLGSDDGLFGREVDLPERVAVVDPLRIDRFEVSVARWRKAVAEGFRSPDETPIANEGPLEITNPDPYAPTLCSWSAAPREREPFALTCVTWAAARAFCRFNGGDVPSEAEWEYAAAVAGRPLRSTFAWGGDDDKSPGCDRAVFGRSALETSAGRSCVKEGLGPQPVDARAGDGGDRTPTFGVVGLSGGVTEWNRDAFAPMTATCWAASGLRSPGCDVTPSTYHAIRGGSWGDSVAALVVVSRRSEDAWSAAIGFRCVRRGGS